MSKICDECKSTPSSHMVGDRRLCCKCYVGEGHPPADWHMDCMKAYRRGKLSENEVESVEVNQETLLALR